MSRRVVSAAAIGISLVAGVPVALGVAPPPAKVVLGGRGFATNVTVTFAAPTSYAVKNAVGYNGTWRGPRWKKSTTGDESDSLLDFSAHSDFTTRSAANATKHTLGTDPGWKVVASGPIDVPHVIRGRKVGVAKGFVLTLHKTAQGYEGWYKAAVGFPLGKGYPVLVADFATSTPGDDSSDTIEGQVPSVWNRKAIEQALAGVALDGNLAAQRVTASVHGRRVAGRIVDTLGHPVVGAKVILRKQGSPTCCSATTSGTGAFVFNAPKSAGTGAFVVSATGAGAALSKTVTLS